jgi:putative hemolysin
LEDFADITGIELEDGPYETVAGYFLAHTGKLGEVGDTFHDDDGYDMTVTAVDGRRIQTIEIRKTDDKNTDTNKAKNANIAE